MTKLFVKTLISYIKCYFDVAVFYTIKFISKALMMQMKKGSDIWLWYKMCVLRGRVGADGEGGVVQPEIRAQIKTSDGRQC